MEPPIRESALSDSFSRSDAAQPADKLQQLLLQLWVTSKATIAERLETLRNAQTRLEGNCLDDDTRKQASSAAHKLAGILGTFGIPRGTDLALQVESAMEGRTSSTLSANEFAAILDELNRLVDQKSAEIPSL
jgi:HPt (histidine-containing phosphotransfer) domain-containing protein